MVAGLVPGYCDLMHLFYLLYLSVAPCGIGITFFLSTLLLHLPHTYAALAHFVF